MSETATSDLARLVPIDDFQVGGALVPTANARDLHAYLEVRRDYSNWIKARIAKYGFAEGADYVIENGSPNLANQRGRGGDRRSVEHHLTLDMAKELAMVENNPKGREVRRYFIECEKRVSAAVREAVRRPMPRDQGFADWLSQSTEERRCRQKDVELDTRLYGLPGGRHTSYQVGRPVPPRWVLTAAHEHELDLARQYGFAFHFEMSGGSDE